MRVARLFVAGSVFAVGIGLAQAQSTAGAGSVIVVPLMVQTASYSTEVTVRNPNPAPITLNMTFYEGNSATPGPKTCTALTVAALESKPFQLSSQCVVTPPPDGHFGLLVLEDSVAQTVNAQPRVFFAYSRTQTPGGNGFSVEGFPIGAFSGAPADVIGLKRQAAAPIYQSNCFVAALGEAVGYQVLLRNGTTNALIGSPMADTLQPFEMKRFLDVFGPQGADAPAGDYSNVRANFTATTGGQALIGFCTVQESTFFGNDFRIAKSIDAASDAQKRVACIGQDTCGSGNPVGTLPETIGDATLRNVYSMIITQPDYVRCDLVAAPGDLPNLQMRLRGPGAPFGTTIFPASAPYDAGGAGKTSFYIDTGWRNAINGGTATRWFVDVETVNPSTTVPIDFGIACQSGNGTEIPWFRGADANRF